MCLAWTPDGRWIATGTRDGAVQVTEAASGKKVHRFQAGRAAAGVAFAPDGKTLAVGQPGDGISTWDLGTGKRTHIMPLRGRASAPPLFAFTPDGQTVVAVGVGSFSEWRLNGGGAGMGSGLGASTGPSRAWMRSQTGAGSMACSCWRTCSRSRRSRCSGRSGAVMA